MQTMQTIAIPLAIECQTKHNYTAETCATKDIKNGWFIIKKESFASLIRSDFANMKRDSWWNSAHRKRHIPYHHPLGRLHTDREKIGSSKTKRQPNKKANWMTEKKEKIAVME